MAFPWLLTAAIQGVVEGLTEFIPVSSTGHLIVSGALQGFTGEKANTFNIVIQVGAILAVIALYGKRFWNLVPLPGHGQGFAGWRGLGLLMLTSLPAVLVGLPLEDAIDRLLFKPLPVALALGVGGLAIIVVESVFKSKPGETDLDSVTWTQALGVGLFQCLSLWPGMSRAASTIMGGRLLGMDRKLAAEYSFFAAVPVLLGASLLKLYKARHMLGSADLPMFGVGFGVSFVVALIAIRGFLALLRRFTLRPFGWYRIVVAPLIYFFVR